MLSIDALPNLALNNDISKEILNKDILWKIENDCDIDEKISILFLMITDYMDGFKIIYDLLKIHQENKTYILTEFINKYPQNWENKLLEAICIIQNLQIIRKLGLSFNYLNLFYLPKNRLFSRYVNLTAKCLYLLCETLSEDKIKLLLQYVKTDIIEYNVNLKDSDFLELHMLYWMQENYISINLDGTVKLENLLKHLKKIEDLESIYDDLKNHENHRDVLDIQHINTSINTSQLQTFFIKEHKISLNNEENIRKIKKGLCIIINQMFFMGEKYEIRFGTETDCMKLLETFKGFNFITKEFNNLKKDEILKMLEDIPKTFGVDYDCIFVCILSHGYEGGIISADEKEVKTEEIEYKFCSIELKDVIKIVIIQACQGKIIGQVEDSLVTDGFINCNISKNILSYRNFCIFMSTIQGFVSMRHKEKGSWFIQEFCNILQNGKDKITFLQAVSKTIDAVGEKKGVLNGINSVAQLPEIKSYRLSSDFQFPEYQAQV